MNAGIPGDTSAGGVRRIHWSMEGDVVKLVILELGANDILRGQSVAEMKKNLSEIIGRAKGRGARKCYWPGWKRRPIRGRTIAARFTKRFSHWRANTRSRSSRFCLTASPVSNRSIKQTAFIRRRTAPGSSPTPSINTLSRCSINQQEAGDGPIPVKTMNRQVTRSARQTDSLACLLASLAALAVDDFFVLTTLLT